MFTNAVPALGLWKASSGDDFVLEAVAWGSGPESTTDTPRPSPPPRQRRPRCRRPRTPATEEPAEEKPGGPQVENPLYDAQVGEWIRFKQSARGAEVIVTVEVVEVTDEEVVLQSTVEIAGRTAEGPEMRQERKRFLELPEDREVEIAEGTTTIDDQELTCIVLKSQGPRGADMEQWICPKVPVMGIVKIVRNGQVVQEILAWGTDGAPTD